MYCKISVLYNIFPISLIFGFCSRHLQWCRLFFLWLAKASHFFKDASQFRNLRQEEAVTRELSDKIMFLYNIPRFLRWQGGKARNYLGPPLANLLNNRIIYICIYYICIHIYVISLRLYALRSSYSDIFYGSQTKPDGISTSVSPLFLSDPFRHEPSTSFTWEPEQIQISITVLVFNNEIIYEIQTLKLQKFLEISLTSDPVFNSNQNCH